MYTEEDLASAVAAGPIAPEAATALREHVAAQRAGSTVDEEHVRLLTGFNDVFVVIACVLALGSLWAVSRSLGVAVAGLATAAAAWGLAEFFTRRRHMALTSMVLVVAFGTAVFAATAGIVDRFGGTALGAALTAGGMALHWRRFKVPISVALAAAAVVGIALTLLTGYVPQLRDALLALCFAAGATIFAFAMRWDTSDPDRRTRRSDVAFWLHLVAAPLLVHPVFASLGILGGHADVAQLIVVCAIYFALALVSLAIDRRALMVSALGYVLWAFTALLKDQGFVTLGFAITGLVLGSALLTLSAYWNPARAAVLRWLPTPWKSRLAAD